MWGIVDNLGLKEGIAEFREQFNKDAKATFADTQFAKDRGIDVAKLDAWEEDLKRQSEDLHDRTIGRAVEALANDETIAQLLELKPEYPEDEGSADAWTVDEAVSGDVVQVDPTQIDDLVESGAASATVAPSSASAWGSAPGATEEEHESGEHGDVASAGGTISSSGAVEVEAGSAIPSPAAASASVTAAPTSTPAAAGADAASTAAAEAGEETLVPSSARGPEVGSVARKVPIPSVPQRPAVAGGGPATRRSAGAVSRERLRHLEAEALALAAARGKAEAQLSAARSQCADLEARWTEISAVSDDALRNAAEARQQATALRHALDERDAQIMEAEARREQLTIEKAAAEREYDELEASFQERLQRDISQKEQELLDEVAYLRKTGDMKERHLQELVAAKAQLERRALDREAEARSSDREMIEAHIAIAKAFGDSGSDNPLVQMLDEPTLKATAAVFRQPLLRCVFYFASGAMWLYTLHRAIAPSGGGHQIHT